MIDLRTPYQKVKDQKHQAICARFRELTNLEPQARPTRVMEIIAGEFASTAPGIRNILIRNGAYKPIRSYKK